MTLNQKSVFRKSGHDYPAMIKFSNAAGYVNKYCGTILNAPCKITFDITKKKQRLIVGDKEGFEIVRYSTGLIIPSRPLILKICEILGVIDPRFAVISTSNKKIFELKLIEYKKP